MELAKYKERVRALAARRNGEAVFNGSPEHAAIIVEQLLSSATASVRLLTGDLEAKVYGDPAVVQAARQFLSKSDHSLCVLVEDDRISRGHPLVQALTGHDNFSMLKVPEELSRKIPYHFMTADNDCFRFEKDKNSHTAIAAFGESAAASNLNGIFDDIKSRCEEMKAVPA